MILRAGVLQCELDLLSPPHLDAIGRKTQPSASCIVTATVRARFEESPGVPAENVLCLYPGSPVPAQGKVGSSHTGIVPGLTVRKFAFGCASKAGGRTGSLTDLMRAYPEGDRKSVV